MDFRFHEPAWHARKREYVEAVEMGYNDVDICLSSHGRNGCFMGEPQFFRVDPNEDDWVESFSKVHDGQSSPESTQAQSPARGVEQLAATQSMASLLWSPGPTPSPIRQQASPKTSTSTVPPQTLAITISSPSERTPPSKRF